MKLQPICAIVLAAGCSSNPAPRTVHSDSNPPPRRSPAELVALTEKVFRSGIERDPDASYVVDDQGDVWVKRKVPQAPPVLVRALGIEMDFHRYLYGVDEDGDVVIHDKERDSGPEKLVRTGIAVDPELLYFVKDGDVWSSPRRQPPVRIKVLSTGLEIEKNRYHYFVDGDGDIARRPHF